MPRRMARSPQLNYIPAPEREDQDQLGRPEPDAVDRGAGPSESMAARSSRGRHVFRTSRETPPAPRRRADTGMGEPVCTKVVHRSPPCGEDFVSGYRERIVFAVLR
jgi:hypothetical protein